MDILGEGCLKHVACRVTVDGTPAEASPVEAPRIQTNNMIETLDHLGTSEDQIASITTTSQQS